ncbi:MAG: cupin domain-containing protein [Candidatus Nanoarchaeia archaeon]|nr:cupin domain-containing protein [Candidatus Nanoarchaeia archaeon]
MKTYDLNKLIEFSQGKPLKKHFLNSKGFHSALICLKKGVEIPPHPEDYAVYLMVLEGKGIFTDINGKHILTKNQGIYIKKDEIRGINAEEDLIVLGTQDMSKQN